MDIYLIFSIEELSKYLKLKNKKKHKLFVFDTDSQVECFNKGIIFETLKINNIEKFKIKISDYENFLNFFMICDKKLINKGILSEYVFSNYHKLIHIVAYYQSVINKIENVITNYKFKKIVIFSNCNDLTYNIFKDLEKNYW